MLSLRNLRSSLLIRNYLQTSGAESIADAMTDFAEIGQARGQMLAIKLEQAGTDSVSGSTTIDPKGYLSGLTSQIHKTDAEIG